MIDVIRNPKGYIDAEKVDYAFSDALSLVKLVCGISNNAAYLVMMDAYNVIRKHPEYKGRIRRMFEKALKEWRIYESSLLRPATGIRLFDISLMDEETRAKYGNITNAEYFEFWQGTGASAYQRTLPMITSLQNKFRLAFIDIGIAYPETIAWAFTALASLQVACDMWKLTVDEVCNSHGMPKHIVSNSAKPLQVSKPYNSWKEAVTALAPDARGKLSSKDERNIEMGVRQLYEVWSSPDGLFGSTADAMIDYSEVFASKGVARNLSLGAKKYKEDLEVDIKEDNLRRAINRLKNA